MIIEPPGIDIKHESKFDVAILTLEISEKMVPKILIIKRKEAREGVSTVLKRIITCGSVAKTNLHSDEQYFSQMKAK